METMEDKYILKGKSSANESRWYYSYIRVPGVRVRRTIATSEYQGYWYSSQFVKPVARFALSTS